MGIVKCRNLPELLYSHMTVSVAYSATPLVLLFHALGTCLALTVLRSQSTCFRGQRTGHAASTSAAPSGVSGRSAPRRAAAPHATPARGTAARLQLRSGIFMVFVQLLAMRKTEVPKAEAACLLTLIAVLLIALPYLCPDAFERHRQLVVSAARLGIFSMPIITNPRGMQHVFQAFPSQKRGGLLTDLWLLTLGSRGLAMFCTPFVCPLPLLPHLAVAVFAFHRCRTAAYMCSCPMLRHPIWQRRVSLAHSAAQWVVVLAPDHLPGTSTSETTSLACRVFATFWQLLVGILAPTLIVARLEAPMMAAAAVAEARRQRHTRRQRRRRLLQVGSDSDTTSSGGSGLTGDAGVRRGGSGRKWASSGACFAWLRNTALSLTASLHHLCDMLSFRVGSWVLSLCTWQMCLSLLWLLALLLELPGAEDAAAAGPGLQAEAASSMLPANSTLASAVSAV